MTAEPDDRSDAERREDNAAPAAAEGSIPVVGIGASAGGFTPVRDLIASLPVDSGLAFVVVQHLDPHSESHLTSLLARHTQLNVYTAEDGMLLEANCVYTIPASRYLGLTKNRIHLPDRSKESAPRMPIDFLFRSLAEERGDRAIGVVLSGTGSDGTLGIRLIRGAGGVAIVQDPDTAEFQDMPRSAIATGLVDAILPVDEMASYLVTRAKRAAIAHGVGVPGDISEQDLNAILGQVTARTQFDFRQYKRNTVVRRVYRRMGLHRIERPQQYVNFLRQHPDEAVELRNDLLIGVTGFFREPEYWDELLEKAIRPLVESKAPEGTIRAWVPGCATGEEAYSLAMLFFEELERVDMTCALHVFASDIDDGSLDVARGGIYPASIENDVPRERLDRYFEKVQEGYRVIKEIRETIVFSHQNVVNDPPFSKLDLVSCRNTLIYFQSEVQKRVMSLFAFALVPGGYLFLGKSDSISGKDDLFQQIGRRGRVFRRRETARPPMTELPGFHAHTPVSQTGPDRDSPHSGRAGVLAMINQHTLLEHFDAAVVLTDSRGKILHFFGKVDRYLTFPTGEAELDLFNMARDRLAVRIRSAFHRVQHGEDTVSLERVVVRRDGETATVNVTLRLIRPNGWHERVVAVILQDVRSLAEEGESEPHAGGDDDFILALESELKSTKEELQATYEEFETSNEELKAANEEVMSMNEELQSSNEELETSKEELESMNEELITVNSQLNAKVEELGNANNDVANLLRATQIAVLFLDPKMRVRRFTPVATELFSLRDDDVGRSIEDLKQRFSGEQVADVARKVQRDLTPEEHEVETRAGDWYTMRALPYRTLDDRIEGVVVTFNKVTHLKQAELFAQSIVQTVRHPLLVLDEDLRVVAANHAFQRLFGADHDEIVGELIYRVCDGQWDVPALRELLEKIIPENEVFEDYQMKMNTTRGESNVLLNARKIEAESGRPSLMLLAIEAATDRYQGHDDY